MQTLKFELKALEQLITETLHPARLTRHQLTNEYITECKWLAKTEVRKAKENWYSLALTAMEGRSCNLYFQYYQSTITELADCVFCYLKKEGQDCFHSLNLDKSLIHFYEDLITMFENFLEYLEGKFPQYFDPTLKIPDAKRQRLSPEINRELMEIETELRKIGLQEKMITIVTFPFHDYLNTEKRVSYQRATYLKLIKKEFQFFIGRDDGTNTADNFWELLVYINFNSPRLYNSTIQQLQENTGHLHSIAEQIEGYQFKLKQLNQQPVKPGVALKPGCPYIKELLGNWILEELSFLAKRREPLQLADYNDQESEKEQKIYTSLSVDHLSLFVKLLVDSKVINNKNAAELLRMVAKNFKTKRNEEISESSLRNKYYTVHSRTLNYVKEMLTGLIKLLRQYEG